MHVEILSICYQDDSAMAKLIYILGFGRGIIDVHVAESLYLVEALLPCILTMSLLSVLGVALCTLFNVQLMCLEID